MLLLIIIIIAGVRIITILFRDNIDKLILEYHELNTLQETKMSLSKMTIRNVSQRLFELYTGY